MQGAKDNLQIKLVRVEAAQKKTLEDQCMAIEGVSIDRFVRELFQNRDGRFSGIFFDDAQGGVISNT
ncbi:MAG: hypothetical protein MSA50_03885 [Veillonellaceae bacterium]|nr:hypothetical protein [Veillonellaceae bacterium]